MNKKEAEEYIRHGKLTSGDLIFLRHQHLGFRKSSRGLVLITKMEPCVIYAVFLLYGRERKHYSWEPYDFINTIFEWEEVELLRNNRT